MSDGCLCNSNCFSTANIVMAAAGRWSSGLDTQRRPVALVVIVQMQWFCQGGGGPSATQTQLNFRTP